MKPLFTGAPIASPEALARALQIDLQDLRTIAGSASSRYSDFAVKKKDGSPRLVSGPKHELKIIQKRINRQIFERVDMPAYLFGGIRERDYVQNATAHSNAKMLVALDIRDFYSNIKYSMVFDVFKYFFHLPKEVAILLADLCTKNGVVPQGACTSSYIANLIFWQHEPGLFAQLREKRLSYTRLIDDIAISSASRISQKNIEVIISSVSSMVGLGGFKLKKRKTKVTSAENPEELMEVTGLWLNRGRPRVLRAERVDIRSEVRKCFEVAKFDRISTDYHALHDRVSGRVAKLAQLNHHEASRFRAELSKILPTYGLLDIRKTKAMVANFKKLAPKNRDSIFYIRNYHLTLHRVNILSRTNPLLAKSLRAELARCAPSKTKEQIVHG